VRAVALIDLSCEFQSWVRLSKFDGAIYSIRFLRAGLGASARTAPCYSPLVMWQLSHLTARSPMHECGLSRRGPVERLHSVAQRIDAPGRAGWNPLSNTARIIRHVAPCAVEEAHHGYQALAGRFTVQVNQDTNLTQSSARCYGAQRTAASSSSTTTMALRTGRYRHPGTVREYGRHAVGPYHDRKSGGIQDDPAVAVYIFGQLYPLSGGIPARCPGSPSPTGHLLRPSRTPPHEHRPAHTDHGHRAPPGEPRHCDHGEACSGFRQLVVAERSWAPPTPYRL